MGESKRREVARLRKEAEGLGPYLVIAQDIQNRVMERVAHLEEEDLESALVQEVATTEERLVRQAITARIGELSAKTVLDWYAKAIGGEEIDALMLQRAQIEVAVLRDNMHVLEMRRWSEVYEAADVSMTKPNDRLVIGFPPTFSSAPDEIRLRRINSDLVLFDVVRSPFRSTNQLAYLESHTAIQIGGSVVPGTNTLDPVISLDAPLSFWKFGEGFDPDDIATSRTRVGYVVVNDIVVLGSVPEA